MTKTVSRPAAADRPSARARLLAAASELFYEEGVHSVGIDRVIERAGVAKASLYDTFGSKEELIRSYLLSRQEARQARILDRLDRFTTPRTRLLGIFDVLADSLAEPNYRGCAFVRASAEMRAGSSAKTVCDDSRPGCARCSPTSPRRPARRARQRWRGSWCCSTTARRCRRRWTATPRRRPRRAASPR